jgi:RNA polymerase sigma-70 factor (ECF subfamily)
MNHKSFLGQRHRASFEGASDEIVLAASQEYPDLFELLVERYQKPFLRLAERILHSKEESQDIVQEAFLKIYRFASKLRQGEDSKFKSWAYKIVFNTALTHYRSAKKRIGEVSYLDTFLYENLEPKDFQDEMDASILVKGILEKMPADFKELLELHYLEGLSYAQISERKNITIPALKMRLFRARELFRDLTGEKSAAV